MRVFTIETTYHLPIFRHRTYVAAAIEEACRLAIADQDWRFERRDYDCAGATYVSGAWLGRDVAYRQAQLPIPSQFDEAVQRKADHFAALLDCLKACAPSHDAAAQAAIVKAEAIIAGKPDPA